jgi:hypothetical protein
MKTTHFCLALAICTLIGCQQDPTQPNQDLTQADAAGFLGKAKHAGTVSASALVHFHPRTGELSSGHTLSGHVNVHQKFSSIDEVCVEFQFFDDDPLSVGDDVEFTIDGEGGGGFFNPGTQAQVTRTLCFLPEFSPETVVLFLDGKAKMQFHAESGSVRIGTIFVTVTGTAR